MGTKVVLVYSAEKNSAGEICKKEGVWEARSVMPAFCSSFSLYWSCRITLFFFYPNEIAAHCEYIRTGDGRDKE